MRNFVLGTDWGADSDDAVAIRVISRYVKQGKARLLGIGINCCKENAYASMISYLEKEGISDTPVGIDETELDFDWRETYQIRLASDKRELSNKDGEDAVRIYRRALANCDGKAEIMEVGFLQTLAKVLLSQPDDISDKSGIDLVKEKVERVWIMGGKWDEDGGREFNLCVNSATRKGACTVYEKCPVPITFLGWEIGNQLITGDKLPNGDTLKQVLIDHGSGNGRESWDPMLVTLAMIGDVEKAGYRSVKGRARVDSENGRNYFTEDENGAHEYVIKAMPNSYYTDMINEIIK